MSTSPRIFTHPSVLEGEVIYHGRVFAAHVAMLTEFLF